MCVLLSMGLWEDLSANELIDIARRAVVAAVRREAYTPQRSHPAKAVFVTIERDGTIRGCRGSLEPRTRSLEEEIAAAARAAAAFDPRYKPFRGSELGDFQVTVTIVDRLEPIDSVAGLSREDGLVVRSGANAGIVLPWEGRDPKVRLEWGYRKAKLERGSPVNLFRLIGRRYRG